MVESLGSKNNSKLQIKISYNICHVNTMYTYIINLKCMHMCVNTMYTYLHTCACECAQLTMYIHVHVHLYVLAHVTISRVPAPQIRYSIHVCICSVNIGCVRMKSSDTYALYVYWAILTLYGGQSYAVCTSTCTWLYISFPCSLFSASCM